MKKQLLLLLSMLMPLMTSAQTEINGIYYYLNSTDKVAKVTSVPYRVPKYTGSIVIPETVTYEGMTYSVTSIDVFAFSDCSSLTSVIIPNSVTSIGEGAFSGCSSLPVIDNCRYADTYLVEVVDKTIATCAIIEETRFIGESAFSGCSSLISVIIPNSVTSIGDDAFQNCSGLTTVTLPNSVTSIGYYAFSDCSGLTSVTIPNSVTSIGGSAFSGCTGLTSVTIPNSVTSIEDWTFRGCSSLAFISIPESVRSIGSGAFSYCVSLGTVYIYIPNINNDYSFFPPVIGGSFTDIFEGCSHNMILYVPNGSKDSYVEIFGGTFKKIIEFVDKDDLNNLNIITPPVFYLANGGQLDFSIEMINDSKIQSLECDIYLPNGLSFITDDNGNANIIWNEKRRPTGEFVDNSYAVSDKHIHISGMGHENTFIGNNGEVAKIGIKADEDLEDGTYPILMRNIKLKDYSNEYQSDSLYSYVEVDGFKDYHLVKIDGIGYNLYMDGKAEVANALVVEEYYWKDTDWAPSPIRESKLIYSENWEVEQHYDPMLKPEILDTLFLYSDSIIIPDKVTYRGNSYNVTTINPHAFRGSKNMTSITIPSTITSIGMNAFLDCKGLKKVIVPDLSAWCAFSFEERNANPIFRSGHIYSDEITEVKDLVIPEGVERIGNYAFYNCDGITSITLPQSLTRIGSYAFYACDAINSVSIPATVTSIKEKAFYGCDNLKSITVGMTVPPTLTAQIASASRTKLYVPKGTKELYEAANYWKDFMEIIEIGETVVITDISGMDNAFYMDEKSVVPGNRYVLPIKLKNNQLVMGYQFDLELPEGVGFALDDNGMVIATMSERGSSFIISKNKRSDRVCRFVVIDASNNVLTGEDGVVMNVTVDVADDMEAGAYGVVFKNGELTIKEDNAISAINLQNVTALMNVVTALLGDVNNDGKVSVTDVVTIISYILGNENTNFSSVAADLNGDGSITVADAVRVINLILNDDSYSKPNNLFEVEEE